VRVPLIRQLDLPLEPASSLPRLGPALLQRDGTTLLVHLIRVRAARRYVLRVRPDGALRVTIPSGGSRAEALKFAERHLAWAFRERTRLLTQRRTPAVWTTGTMVSLDGELHPIVRSDDGGHEVVRVGHVTAPVQAGARDLRPALERALRETARRDLPAQLLAMAATLGFTVAGVSIRNQRSRWGSCSSRGRITLNFRLIQMPPSVRQYILVHELMHLQQPNHSRRFWALVQQACPEFRAAEKWLRTTGRTLF
jgi:predicted metal-dependent hydrolase